MSDLRPMPRLRRLRKSEEGQALVLAALGMIVLMMMAGLGVDVGYLKYQKQQMQKAADAGALAGATALINYGNTVGQKQVTKAAQSDAAANGYQDGQNGVSVKVNNPPKTSGDPFEGKPEYVEVIVSQVRPTFFMRLAGYNSINVSSRAVATAASSGSGCLYSLAPSGPNTFSIGTVGGSSAQLSSNCGIMVASNSGTALSINSGDTVNTTANIGVVGDCSGSDCQTLLGDGELTQGVAPFTDPLATLPAPSVSGCTYNQTFYNTTAPGGGGYAPVSMQNGTPTGSLTAPTSGDLAGILFFQDRRIQANQSNASYINGSGGAVYTGTLYFPTTGLTYNGARVTDPYELIIGWQLTFLGNTVIANHYGSAPGGVSPIANATLVE